MNLVVYLDYYNNIEIKQSHLHNINVSTSSTEKPGYQLQQR